MKIGDRLYARIDYKIEGKELTPQDYEDCLVYLKDLAAKGCFAAGVFSNADGAMVIFAAENLEQAHKIAEQDPIIQRGLYRYELFEWNVMILSEEQKNA